MRAALVLLLPLALFLQPQDPVGVNPKIVKVEYENNRVLILRIRCGAHERLEMHSHLAEGVVRLTDGSARVNFSHPFAGSWKDGFCRMEMRP